MLRGITPEEIAAVGGALATTGFRVLEVPLNSPQPFEPSARSPKFGHCLVGAGTVIDAADVARVGGAGAADRDAARRPRVILEAKARGSLLPGVATPTEAFAALAAGADGLKMFPAERCRRPR